MSLPKEEDLKGLFEKFLNAEQAEMSAEDVRIGEQILREQPAPEPSGELIGEIKAKVGRTLLSGKANSLKRAALKVAAVAAVFFVLAAIGVKLFEGGDDYERLMIPKAIWESEDITADDEDLAILTAEIEEMEGELLAVEMGENGGNGAWELTELEMELVAINSDFWKG